MVEFIYTHMYIYKTFQSLFHYRLLYDIEWFALETIFFKKVRDTKGTFHAKMGSIKDKNGMDLTEAEDIKRRWQEYTEELYKKRSSQRR